MAKGPKWFQSLPKRVQDGIEQTLHLLAGIVAGAFCLDLVVWWREWVDQWPPGEIVHVRRKPWAKIEPHTQLARVADTKRDLLFFGIGSTIGHVARTVLIWRIA